MWGRAIKHLRGNAIAYLALFVALGGSAYAAKKIGTKQLKRNAVTSQKILNGTVQPVDVSGALANGARSAKIVARCRIGAPATVTAAAFASIPGLTGCSWGQPAGAIDTLYARARMSRPATCTGGENLHIRVLINSSNLVLDTSYTPAQVPVSPSTGSTFLLAVQSAFTPLTPDWNSPTTVPPWTLSPQAFDSCDGNYTLNKFEIVVVRAAS